MNAFTTLTLIGKKSILAIGLEDNFHALVHGGDRHGTPVKPVFIDNAFKAFRWLEDRLNEGAKQLPYAILIDYKFLEKGQFQFLDSIRANKNLRNIPFVAITDSEVEVDAAECLKRGMDDCYTRPVDWSDLRRRLEFLHQHKEDILAQQPHIESYEFKVPLGKRLFDIILAGGALLVLSPFLLLIALLIKLESKGPVIYKSKRVGSGYHVFDFLKFRSMVVDADEKLAKLAHLNQYDQDNTGKASFVKLTNDPRITRIGKFIRKTSLDEMPQLFNVLRGEMSIVGNRPLPMYEAVQMTRDQWSKRFWAPAGLTGLWQVNPKGKDNLTVEERIELDVKYAESFSMWMDLKIISKTIPAMIQKED